MDCGCRPEGLLRVCGPRETPRARGPTCVRWQNLAPHWIRTRTSGGVGGAKSRNFPLTRLAASVGGLVNPLKSSTGPAGCGSTLQGYIRRGCAGASPTVLHGQTRFGCARAEHAAALQHLPDHEHHADLMFAPSHWGTTVVFPARLRKCKGT